MVIAICYQTQTLGTLNAQEQGEPNLVSVQLKTMAIKRRDFLTYSALFLSGCTATKIANFSSSSTLSSNRPTELKFAVTDVSGLEELKQHFEPFRQSLERILEIPIAFYPVPNYSAAAPALLANELDLALAGPSEYLLLRGRAQAEPVVKFTRPDYYSMLMVRSDSEITSVADLKGQAIAMRTEGSTAGHIFPMKLLMDAGVNPEDVQIKMLGKEGVNALAAGEVAAWAASYIHYVELVKNQGLDQDITILAEGELLPSDVFVANPSLGPSFIQELQSTLLTHQETLLTALASTTANQKYQTSSMAVAQDSDYDTMRSIYRVVGLESAIQ